MGMNARKRIGIAQEWDGKERKEENRNQRRSKMGIDARKEQEAAQE